MIRTKEVESRGDPTACQLPRRKLHLPRAFRSNAARLGLETIPPKDLSKAPLEDSSQNSPPLSSAPRFVWTYIHTYTYAHETSTNACTSGLTACTSLYGQPTLPSHHDNEHNLHKAVKNFQSLSDNIASIVSRNRSNSEKCLRHAAFSNNENTNIQHSLHESINLVCTQQLQGTPLA